MITCVSWTRGVRRARVCSTPCYLSRSLTDSATARTLSAPARYYELTPRHKISQIVQTLVVVLLLASPVTAQQIFHLHLFLASASSSVTSTTLTSSLIHLILGLPRFIFPGSYIPSILLPIYPSSCKSGVCLYDPLMPLCDFFILHYDFPILL